MIDSSNATSYVKKFKIGITQPFIINDSQGNSYVCKVFEEDHGQKHLVNEYVCYCLAKMLNLPIPDAKLIHLNDEIINENEDLVNRNIKSKIAFGSILLNDVKTNLTPPLLEYCKNTEVIPSIILFDQLILNEDRATNDGNLLFDFKKKKLYIIDHSHVFEHGTIWDATTLKQIIESKKLLVDNFNKKYYRMLNRYINGYNPFNEFLNKINNIGENVITEIVYSIPNEWDLSDKDSNALIEFLLHRINMIPDILEEISKYCPSWKGGISIGR
ncbi:HipA family kinase [Ureibacillus thermosphaericus]|uniref:HipA-like kinase domain-containing protein n=1 Tax=Ureibacillus thermosphaericus TaxID=51173 RepID=A0A840PRI6_URETH|nr:HipA family kinase [Ureibacillus thermosphaericus]MBB5148613.1 hypothetical protein [Ureibacillus thermosphaericus]NKZ31330.1 hypothetical protein [Ureibacillus thermosphaericus]